MTIRAGATEPAARRARRALVVIFFLDPAAIASWAPHIPGVKRDLALGSGTLGLALLGLAVGAVSAQLAAGALAARAGSRPVTTVSLALVAVTLPLPVLAPNVVSLVVALVLLGVGVGAIDVAMNVQATSVQAVLGRPVLSGLHASYSFGLLAGAGLGALAVGAGLDAWVHLAATGLVVAGLGLAACRVLLPGAADAAPEGPLVARPSRELAALGVIGFCVALCEGGTADWSAVYMDTELAAAPGVAGLAFAAFAGAHAAGRLAGDGLLGRLGAVRLIRAGGLFAAVGFGAGLAVGRPVAAIAAFALLGLGIAAAFPTMIAAAARVEGEASATAIAAVSTVAYVGFLAGPPAIGGIAELVGLDRALALLVVAAGVTAVLASATRRADP
jgi:MFS family permease